MKTIPTLFVLAVISVFAHLTGAWLVRECHDEIVKSCGDATDMKGGVQCLLDTKFSDQCRQFIDENMPCLSSINNVCHDEMNDPLATMQCLIDKSDETTEACQSEISSSPIIVCRDIIEKMCPEAEDIEDDFACIKKMDFDKESPCFKSLMEFGRHWRIMSKILGATHQDGYHKDHSHGYHHHMGHDPHHHYQNAHGPYRHSRDLCMEDLEEFCQDSELPPPLCLAKHRDEISSACLEVLKTSLPFRCETSIEAICDEEIHEGPGAVHDCLIQHLDDVEEDCREAIMEVEMMTEDEDVEVEVHEPRHWKGHGDHKRHHRHHHPIVAFLIATCAIIFVVGLVSYFRRRRRAETVQYRPFV